MSHLRSTLIVLLAFPLLVGCGDDLLPTYPTTGTVTKGGKPIEGASVMFFPQGGSQQFQELVPPRGMTGPDGEFTLSTYGVEDGAPAGVYKVTVTWNEAPSGYRPKPGPHDFPEDDDEGEQVVGSDAPDRLRGQYGDAATTPLTATVVEGENQLPPFDL